LFFKIKRGKGKNLLRRWARETGWEGSKWGENYPLFNPGSGQLLFFWPIAIELFHSYMIKKAHG